MLAQIDPIKPGDRATPNLWNSRFAELTRAVNGNLDSDNLLDRGVSREKIAQQAVGPTELAPMSIRPSHMNNVWVGTSDGRSNVTTSYFTAFNKTISIEEAAYIYVLWTAAGNANNTTVDPEIRILVNDVVIEKFSGGVGLELFTAKLHADYPFAASGISANKISGNVNVKIQARSSNSNGWDLGAGFVRIDALGDGSYLG